MSDQKRSGPKKPVPVLFENEQVIVFDKPAGLLVIPSPKNEAVTLVSEVNAQFKQEHPNARLYPCHRLDRDTTGVILFAKTKKNQQMMMNMFRDHKMTKIYTACVQGALKSKKGEIRGFISSGNRVKYRKDSRGQFAHSTYRVIQQKRHFCIVEIRPVTGRTNQIRIQFANLGHPLVGDRKFSIAKNYPVKFKRTALHAATLMWNNPLNNAVIKVNSNLPKDMEAFCGSN